jgi:tetratricopeptide (TPR) repeat protein
MAENPRIEELRRRVQADPASIVFAALAEEFRRVGRYDEAVETCRTGLQRHPAYLSARVTLGRALIETGDFEGAREQLETVLRSAPENLAAIRGLAQIHERLGHSAEMDPHIADMMNTMHAESIRAAAVPPPEPEPEPRPAPPELEFQPPPPPVSMAPEPLDEARDRPGLSMPEISIPGISMAPEPAARTETVTDPFAGFAQMSKPASAAQEYSFDLAAAPPLDLPIAPEPEPYQAPYQEPEPEPEPELQMQPEPEPVLSAIAGPDPEVLATLARLERFLGAIQTLRA